MRAIMTDITAIQVLKKEIRSRTTIRLFDELIDINDYSELFDILNKAHEHDIINILLNSPGGCCAIGFEIINAMEACKGTINIVVTYPTYSMGALIALSGDTLGIEKEAYLMFHDFSTGISGKGDTILEYTTHYADFFKKRFNKICVPFLTKAESRQMFDGKDIYITGTDANLEKRLERWQRSKR